MAHNYRTHRSLTQSHSFKPHETFYPEMATAMGINPSTMKYVPFDIVNSTYAKNLHDIMLRPVNQQGIGIVTVKGVVPSLSPFDEY